MGCEWPVVVNALTRKGPMKLRSARNLAISFPEVLVAITVLGFVVIAITQAITVAQAQSYEALYHEQGMALAELMW